MTGMRQNQFVPDNFCCRFSIPDVTEIRSVVSELKHADGQEDLLVMHCVQRKHIKDGRGSCCSPTVVTLH